MKTGYLVTIDGDREATAYPNNSGNTRNRVFTVMLHKDPGIGSMILHGVSRYALTFVSKLPPPPERLYSDGKWYPSE